MREHPTVKVIKTGSEYIAALAEVESLVEQDPALGTPEADRLEVLALLVQDYESRALPDLPVDPISAIQFRMDQQDLTQRDLIPYIGSRNRVSEVLSGKRPLTIDMIRGLHRGLGIPLEALVQESPEVQKEDTEEDWKQYPFREMLTRRWFRMPANEVMERPGDALREFFGGLEPTVLPALYKRTIQREAMRTARPMDVHALRAWTARIVRVALDRELPAYVPGTVTRDFMQEVARLSPADNGPRLALDFLAKHGIPLVIERHLPRTHLDGAAVMYREQRPIIGLSVRYDRLDNFWFCLMHELAHVALHFGHGVTHFYDDLDVPDGIDPREREADTHAREALVPSVAWEASPLAGGLLRSPRAAQYLANELHVHPAIVAGRMRYETNSYRILNELVGQGQVRSNFPEVHWGDSDE